MHYFRVAFAALPFLLPALPGQAAPPSAADHAWITRCVAQLVQEHADKGATRAYCTCMHEYFDDNATVTQTEMERMFPPAHRLCRTKAGWK